MLDKYGDRLPVPFFLLCRVSFVIDYRYRFSHFPLAEYSIGMGRSLSNCKRTTTALAWNLAFPRVTTIPIFTIT